MWYIPHCFSNETTSPIFQKLWHIPSTVVRTVKISLTVSEMWHIPRLFSTMWHIPPTVVSRVKSSLTVSAMWQLPRLFRWRGREGLCQHCDAIQNWRYPCLDKIFKKFSFSHINTFQDKSYIYPPLYQTFGCKYSKYIKNVTTYQVFLTIKVLQIIIMTSSADL